MVLALAVPHALSVQEVESEVVVQEVGALPNPAAEEV